MFVITTLTYTASLLMYFICGILATQPGASLIREKFCLLQTQKLNQNSTNLYNFT